MADAREPESHDTLDASLCGIATAVIIGRVGSKGFPGKNAAELCGRPIVHYSIDHAIAAKSIGRIIVSTDCPKLASAASQYDEVEIVDRPAALASDTATVDAAVRHAVDQTEDRSSIIVILYANVPIRPDGLLDRAVAKLIDSKCDSVQSYTSVGKYHPYWEMRIDECGRVSPFVDNVVYRRQDLPPLFIPDGGVMAVKRTSLHMVCEDQPHAFLGIDRRGIINETGSVVDIDSPVDLLVAEAILQHGRGTEPIREAYLS